MAASEQSFPVTEAYRGMRLDRFLQAMVPRMSRNAIQEAIESRVRLESGTEPKANRRPAIGDTVYLAQRIVTEVPDVAIEVLHEVADWSVINKPAGIATTPSSRRPGADIATLLNKAPAHRLDLGTSGCLLLVHNADAARHFEAAFRERRIDKQYLAVVSGSVEQNTFTINAPIGLDPDSRLPHKVRIADDGAHAETHFEVIERRDSNTLVRAKPRTGRRHQIRVHLAHAGHAILGDLLYGGDERRFIRWLQGQPVEEVAGIPAGRHLLHASELVLPLPNSTDRLTVTAPLPADFDL
jgi:23S rRNA pseudouridine1911/1915/1917 synthase